MPNVRKSSKSSGASSKQPFQLWADTIGPTRTRLDIWEDSAKTESPLTIELGSIVSVNHSTDTSVGDWIGRVEGFREWSPSVSKHGWTGHDVDLVRLRWFQKTKGPVATISERKADETNEWMPVLANDQGSAWSIENLWAIRGVVEHKKLGKSILVHGAVKTADLAGKGF